jgi:hypothetical protein
VDGNQVRLTLSGRLAGEYLVEFQRLIKEEAGHDGLVIDLKQVTLVDRDAVKFLARCEARGAALDGCPAYVREWIVTERKASRRSRRGSRGRKGPGGPST